MSIEGQGHFFPIYFPGFVCFVPRYQVSVYRTNGPLVFILGGGGGGGRKGKTCGKHRLFGNMVHTAAFKHFHR